MNTGVNPQFRHADDSQAHAWDEYVRNHPSAGFAHLWAWRKSIESSYGHRAYYLVAEADAGVVGVLPLFLIRSLVFGRVLASCPFTTVGAICADSALVAQALAGEAVSLADSLGAKYLELKSHTPTGLDRLVVDTDYRNYVLALQEPEVLLRSVFDKDTRAAIRQAERAGLRVQSGEHFLPAYYEILAQNMRRLGTPVHARRFYQNLLRNFGSSAKPYVCFRDRDPVACSLVLGFRETATVLSAASLHQFLRLRPNNLLYWRMIQDAWTAGFRRFECGRSLSGSGTAKFKESYGAIAEVLHYEYYLVRGKEVPKIRQDNPRFQLVRKVWSHLPLWVTKTIGPLLIRGIP